ncbi:MAG TPA: biopolymer transporter ExbD [Victivallales bacterium]|nr:biopolymer transporter ExbD [Victivallales bacterium]HPO89665.1 biopolymer transporter ExbD [Victivallales bacterium]HRU01374.1 biopolymer transporter ExbD [Victivallales bacterium]
MPRQRSQLRLIDDINMTPLIDLTFLLLITFMITVPLMEYGVNVTPPEMNAEKLPDENFKVINLDKNGIIQFDKKKCIISELKEELIKARTLNNKLSLLIRADGSRQYKEVMEIMKVAKEAGIKEVSLVTQAE